MKKDFFIAFLVVAGTLLAVAACKKAESIVTVKTKKDLLVAAPWKIASLSIDTSGDGKPDVNYPVQNCNKDDRYIFKADSTLSYDPGPVVCDTADKPYIATWVFRNNETQLVFDGQVFGISKLDAVTLELFIDQTYLNKKYRLFITYVH